MFHVKHRPSAARGAGAFRPCAGVSLRWARSSCSPRCRCLPAARATSAAPDGWAAPVRAGDLTILQHKTGELAAIRLSVSDNPGTDDIDERIAWRFPGDNDDVDLEAVYATPIPRRQYALRRRLLGRSRRARPHIRAAAHPLGARYRGPRRRHTRIRRPSALRRHRGGHDHPDYRRKRRRWRIARADRGTDLVATGARRRRDLRRRPRRSRALRQPRRRHWLDYDAQRRRARRPHARGRPAGRRLVQPHAARPRRRHGRRGVGVRGRWLVLGAPADRRRHRLRGVDTRQRLRAQRQRRRRRPRALALQPARTARSAPAPSSLPASSSSQPRKP